MKENREKVFPYGTHIYRVPNLPIPELKKDMVLLKRLGFNMVKIQESWSHDEVKEGEVNLSDVEELVKEAEKLSLFVCLGITMEQAPAWLWRKYPDCRLVYNTGEPHNDPTQYLLPADGKPGPCWDHPEARNAGEKFIKELVKKLGKYKNIITWNVWQEVEFRPMYLGKLGFCYCPHTLAKFRKWLRKKYGSLEKLNDTWKTSYGEWEEVEPPRFHPYVHSWIDWRYFMDDVYLATAIKWKVSAFKDNDPLKRPVFCHVGSPTTGSGKDWRYAKEVDFFGSSCYPAWDSLGKWDAGFPSTGGTISKEKALKAEMWNSISLRFDYIRGVSKEKEFWAAEFQGGPAVGFLHKGRTPTKEDIRRWVLTALSTGISGLSFWNHRVEISWQEAYGFGLLPLEGNITDRAKEAGDLSKAINKYGEFFKKSNVAESQAAIFINEDLYHFCEGTPITSWDTYSLTNNLSSHLTHTIRGIYKMLWEEGILVDFVEEKEIKTGEMEKYKVIILPFPLAISDELMERLRDYVNSGGVLISEACPGRYDKHGFARPGEINSVAEQLFGVQHKDVILCQEPEENHWTPTEWSYGEILLPTRFTGTGVFNGHSVLANLYVESFSLKEAIPILLNGEDITGVVNRYGKGKVYLIGTFLGHAGATYEDKPTQNFIVKLITDAGVKQEKCGKLLRRKRILNDKEAWFLINPTADTISEAIDFRDFAKVEDLLESSFNKNKSVEVQPFSVRVIILGKE